MNQEDFIRSWQTNSDFKFGPTEKEEICIHAEHFLSWAEALYRDEISAPTIIGINQKMLLLTKKYFEWRAVVPKSHRDRIGERSHVCIFHIFERIFYQLKALELAMHPPMLFLPSPPPPPALPVLPTITGITLGEIMGEEE